MDYRMGDNLQYYESMEHTSVNYNSSYNDRGRNQRNKSWRKQDRPSNSGHYKSANSDHESQKFVIYIDSDKVGKLIGIGGVKIRELQDKTNTKISVDKSITSTTAAVVITGSKQAQEEANNMIEKLLNNNHHSTAKPDVDHTVQAQKPQIDYATFDWTQASKECDDFQNERWSKCPPIIKNFYKEDPVIAAMPEKQVAHIRKINNNIEVKYVFEEQSSTEKFDVPNPIETFEQAFRDYPEILEEIRKQGFVKPSPIQCQGWPILLSGKDLIGIAQTGTGKTLAFLLPALIHIAGQSEPRTQRSGPNLLVMAPTRELALQIEKEVGKYSYRNIKAVCVYGGGNRKEQINEVTKGVEIVIATPGRLNDLIQANILDVTSVTYLVLDEADRMLDMGFEPQIRKVLLDIRPDRQTVMTSATWPQGVRRLAQSYMKNPIQIFVGSLDLAVVHTVTQKVYIVDENEKTDMMYDFLREMSVDDKVIIFFGKKSKVDDVASDLVLEGINCQSIHGGRQQCDREQALEDLKTGDVKILLATDVASRGIDIEDISHVFNFDFPRDIEEYVHRVGRTGRAGRTGTSITLMTRKDWSLAKELINILEEASQEVPKELYKMAEKYKEWKQNRMQETQYERSDAQRYGGNRRSNGRQSGNRWNDRW